jgi:histidinol dehydrogenase
VTEATRLVAADIDGAAIDLPAGPSEVLVIADGHANAESVAADLLAQAEHGPDSQVVLIADDRALLEASVRALRTQLDELPRREIAAASLAHARVFLGPWSPESVGDYCSGTNHVLPTYGHARAWSGVSVASFLKQITVQELTSEGLRGIGPCAATLARSEGLHAHERAVTRRLAMLGEQA